MSNNLKTIIISSGLAIFAMLFGSGNLIYPPSVGIFSGEKAWIGILAFLISGVLIPLTGLIGMVLYKGDYRAFFNRIGKVPGNIAILCCMLIIGPLLAMPRIVDTTYELMYPFISNYTGLLSFSILFAVLSFALSYKKSSLIDVIGKILSPLILILLLIIFIVGLITNYSTTTTSMANLKIFKTSFILGYNTLDLLGALFFGYIIVSILESNDKSTLQDTKKLAKTMISSSLIAGFLLAVVYVGLGAMGALHGKGLENLGVGKKFIALMQNILGNHGAFIISFTVLLACLTTIIALASVVTEYLRHDVVKDKISYKVILFLVLAVTTVFAQAQLDTILYYSEPFILILYPTLIVLTLCNIAYKLWDFKYVKLPVFITLLIATIAYSPTIFAMFFGNLINFV